jgi:hypothetical protein
MDLLLESLNLPTPNPEDVGEWDEAYGKVENYLRACRVGSRLHRARLTAVIVQRAIARKGAGQTLSTVAIEEARSLISAWLSGLLPPRPDDRPYTQSEGFLALYLSGAPMRWPNAFLNPREAPPGFLDTLRARVVKTGPELDVSSMVPRTIDRGLLPELAGSAMETFDRFPVLRALLFWGLFAAALVALFWYTRR